MLTLITGRTASVLSRRNDTNVTALFLTAAYTSLPPRAISYSSVNTIRPLSPSSTDPSTSTNQLNSSWTLTNTQKQQRAHFHYDTVCNIHVKENNYRQTHTHTHLTALCPGLPGWAGTRKVTPIWILLKQETVSGSDSSWVVCKFAPRSRQITTPAPHHSVFSGRMPFLPPNQQRQSTEGTTNRQTTINDHKFLAGSSSKHAT